MLPSKRSWVWKFSRFTRKREHAVVFKSMLRAICVENRAQPPTTGRQHPFGVTATLHIPHLTDIRPPPARSLIPRASSDRRRSIPSVDWGLQISER